MRDMIRSTALAGFFGMALAPVAAQAATTYLGGGMFHGFTGCESQGWQGIAPFTARLSPAGLPENHPDETYLVVQLGGGTHVYRINEALGGEYIDVDYWDVWSHAPYDHPGVQVRMRLIQWASDPLDPEMTEFVGHGQIENFNGLVGCTARIGLAIALEE